MWKAPKRNVDVPLPCDNAILSDSVDVVCQGLDFDAHIAGQERTRCCGLSDEERCVVDDKSIASKTKLRLSLRSEAYTENICNLPQRSEYCEY